MMIRSFCLISRILLMSKYYKMFSFSALKPSQISERRREIKMQDTDQLRGIQDELQKTEQQVAAIIESFIELGVSIYDFPGTQEATQGMVTNLRRNVDRLLKLNQRSNDPSSPLHQLNIPIEVLQYIEDGRNPDIYTREFVEAIRRSNQYQRAKMNGLRQLRESLAEKIVEEFPDLEQSVQGIIQRTGGSSKQETK